MGSFFKGIDEYVINVYESYVKVKVYIFYKIKKIKILMSSLHFFILLNIAISYNMMMFT